MPSKAIDTPGLATAENDLVLLDGPGSIAVTMTADAAEQTARSLYSAALEARKSALGPANLNG